MTFCIISISVSSFFYYYFKWNLFITVRLCARTTFCMCGSAFMPRCDFLLVRFRSLGVPDWLFCGCARNSHLTVVNLHWPAQITYRHWTINVSIPPYYWLSLLSSYKNAEVVQSTESPLCQLILSEWVTRFIFYNYVASKQCITCDMSWSCQWSFGPSAVLSFTVCKVREFYKPANPPVVLLSGS